MAADRMADDGNTAGGLAGLGDIGDIGEMMKNMDADTLQQLMMEGMKDPAIQEMVRVLTLLHGN